MDFLIYDAKVAVLIAVFYMFYRLMLARETFHRVNRLVLLLTAVASFVLPLCVITMHETVTMEAMPVMTVDNLTVDDVAPMPEPVVETPWWQILLPVLFMIGMVVTIGHTLMSMFRILMLIKRSEKHPQSDGTTICVSGNADVPPFSWMHYIVMNQSDYAERNAAILAHERGHIRLRHSWDLLLVDTLTALQWFNPAMWMLRSDLRAIHEYEADGEVLSLGINARQYQYLLITKAASIGGYSLANGISHSTLKNRINMMLHKKSNQSSLLKLLALVPIVGIALAVNAETVVDVRYDEPQKQVVKKGKKAGTIKVEDNRTVLQVVETEEQKGEDVKITVHVIAASDNQPVVGAIGTVKGTKNGSVTDRDGVMTMTVSVGSVVEVMYVGLSTTSFTVDAKSTDIYISLPSEEEPATGGKTFDVVDEMPQFPGGPSKQNGEPTRVKYTVPVTFRLDDGIKGADDPLIDRATAYIAGYYAAKNGLPPTLQPLILVDDKEVSYDELGKIKSESIDHMDVLKDKSATEKYGEKGKYGVILITTKKNTKQ